MRRSASSMPAHPAAPTSSTETPMLASALPGRRAAPSSRNPHRAHMAAAPMLAHGPQVASQLSWPCRNDCDVEGTDTVTGTVSFVGTVTWWLVSICCTELSLSIGARSTTHSGSCPDCGLLNNQLWTALFASANNGGKAGPAV